MKTIIIIVILSFATALSAQNMIDLHPYEFTEAEQELLDDLGASDSFDCQIRTCPTKFKASDMNLFALKTGLPEGYADAGIKCRSKTRKKIADFQFYCRTSKLIIC